MKKFSLKALGASLLTAGLILVGAVLPASASTPGASWNGPAPTFAAGDSPAMNINFVPSNSSPDFRQVAISIRNAAGNSVPSGVTTAASNSNCKVTSVSGANVRYVNFCDSMNSSGQPRMSYTINAVPTGVYASGAFNLQVESGVFSGLSSGSYSLWVATTDDFTIIDSYLLPFTIGAPPSATISPSTFNITGTVGSPITPTAGFTASNFSGSVTYSAQGLPSGLTISSSTGVISGTPTAAVSGSITINANGATSGSAQATGGYSFGGGGGGGGGGSSASASITLGASQGQLVAGSSVAIVASGLEPTAAYTVVVQSNPQTIGSGNAVNGAVNETVTLPSNLGPGWHTLTFSSTAADGSAMTSVLYFEVAASGTLLGTSTTKPAELAKTGFESMPFMAGGAALLVMGALAMAVARRRHA